MVLKIFSMFSGIGGFEYGVQQSKLNCKFIGHSEIDKYAESIYQNHFHNKNYGDATLIDTDELQEFDFLTGGFPCFIGNMLVRTIDGFKPINKIKVDDLVLTHKNRYQKVLHTMSRPFNDRGRKISLTYLGKSLPIITTEEHPFYVYNNGNPIWKNAKELTTDDFVYVPLCSEKKDEITFTYTKYINQYKSVENTEILNDLDWWWCVGYYIGDGWRLKRRKRNGKWSKTTRITLACNPNQCDYIVSRFSKFFNCHVQKDKKKIVFLDVMFYKFVSEHCGDGAINKHFPLDFESYPKEILSSLFEGYLYADGYENDKLIGITTISKVLVQQLFIVLLILYEEMAQIQYSERPKTTEIEGRVVNQNNTYQIRLLKNKSKHEFSKKNNGYWIRVRNNDEIDINEQVYNLEVENDNSYTIGVCAAHNCQSFSISGRRKGFDDTRGTMFFEIARILKDKRPRYFLLENVRNLLSHDKGETFKRILAILTDMGYIVEWDLLNSQNFGLPQRRERVFIRGYSRRRTSIDEILYFRKNCSETLELNSNNCLQLNNDKKRYQDGRIYSKDGLSIAMNARGNNGWYVIDDTKQCPCTQDDTFFAVTTRPRGMPFRKKQDNYVVYKDMGIRRLTPLECERLQGFPDSWTKYGVDGEVISDTQRYKCIGNAVSTNVITWIINNMFMC